ncbi:Cullin binding-domain-containing protein [Lophiotrema nucula]|uniref:Defective in cullin neddylation protein n=1 Tax=Lophiotrema nucula TaxID=690887 RepID=A0A6A5YZB5_9PLEO|nr:Cullin binding-domain-containing protein [Lophiotrema nucula]
MPPGYTSQQKSAISQFQNFTQADRNTAIRWLKSSGWVADQAVNGYFSGGGGATSNTSGSESKLRSLFDKYRDDPKNSPDIIGVDGSMKYLDAIGVNLEGLDSFAAMEIIQAPSMGEISRDGFVNGWAAVGADSIEKQKAHINFLKKSLPSDKTKFTEIYKFSFQLGKTAQQKAIPLENAAGFWELLFSSPMSPVQWRTPNSPWIDWWGEFLTSKWKKSVNKDMWNETLKFAQMTLDDEQISFWNEESSWPSVIDDFVEFVKEKRGGGEEAEAMEY